MIPVYTCYLLCIFALFLNAEIVNRYETVYLRIIQSTRDTRGVTECGGNLTNTSGSFQSPGWPHGYPHKNFQCEWIIELPNTEATIEFIVDNSTFGINGRAPCTNDHIQFFDGTASNANSLLKLCNLPKNYDFKPITTTSSRARVVFTGSAKPRLPSRKGVKVDYRTIESKNCIVHNSADHYTIQPLP